MSRAHAADRFHRSANSSTLHSDTKVPRFAAEWLSASGIQGLVTKDAMSAIGGGNHFSAYINNGVLTVKFEDDGGKSGQPALPPKVFTAQGILANEEYRVHATFGGGKVYAWLNDTLIGYANFKTDRTANTQYLQVGAHNGWLTISGGPAFSNVFDGTISDLRIATGLLTPAQLRDLPDPPISFRFNAETVTGRQGLISKDAIEVAGGGNHFSAWLEDDVLKFQFQDDSDKTSLRLAAIKAGQAYKVLAVFDDEQVSLCRGNTLVGQDDFSIDLRELDRLSRNAAFLLTLRDSGVRFAAVDLPEANDLTVGIMALVAQQEREAISKRTKEALAVARARGVKLGNPNGAAALRLAGKGGAPLREVIARNADRHAQDLAPVVADIRASGATSLQKIAADLNARGMLTRRGGCWHVSTVMNLLDRLGLREAACVNPG